MSDITKKISPYKSYNRNKLDEIKEKKNISEEMIKEMKIVSLVLPFRTNNYMLNELINWENIPDDPIFRLNFPQKEMLLPHHYEQLEKAIDSDLTDFEIQEIVKGIRSQLNPNIGGQIDYNRPIFHGKELKGIQHKYRETVLVFPSEGQMCHAFCTYCFRWNQFIGQKEMKMELNNPDEIIGYIQEQDEIQDLLITGGDPMIMKARKLSKYINPILEAEIPHLSTIRIGSKSLTYWPYRFISDSDTEEILQLFKEIVDSGLHLTFVANFNHPNELETEELREAVKNIQSTRAIIRTQSPILRNINDSSECLAVLWRKQVDLGMVPYYMFIPRDTGAKHYFDVPLVKASRIFQKAYRRVSGICNTAKGPVMSTTPGKIHVIGITNIGNSRVIVLKFIQGRNPAWVGRPFFAKFNPNASWISDLVPAFSRKFFYEHEIERYLAPYSNQKRLCLLEKESQNEEIESESLT